MAETKDARWRRAFTETAQTVHAVQGGPPGFSTVCDGCGDVIAMFRSLKNGRYYASEILFPGTADRRRFHNCPARSINKPN